MRNSWPLINNQQGRGGVHVCGWDHRERHLCATVVNNLAPITNTDEGPFCPFSANNSQHTQLLPGHPIKIPYNTLMITLFVALYGPFMERTLHPSLLMCMSHARWLHTEKPLLFSLYKKGGQSWFAYYLIIFHSDLDIFHFYCFYFSLLLCKFSFFPCVHVSTLNSGVGSTRDRFIKRKKMPCI